MSNTARRHGGGLGQQFAHSLDSAFRLLRTLTSVAPTRPAVAKPPRRGKPAPRAAAQAPKAQVLDLQVAHQRLASEVTRLEQELERVHGKITSGSAAALGEPSGQGLTAFMEAARQLREQIQEKRLELARLDRTIARERQLAGQSAQAIADVPVAPPTGNVARPKSPRPPLAQRAVVSALRESHFADRGERALVAGMAEGLLSEDPEVRRQAVARIGGRPQPASPLLVLASEDPDDRVRLAALAALTGQRHRAAAGVFRRFLRDKSSALRLAALRGLASIDERLLTSGDLVATLEDSDAGVRRAAAAVLGWRREDSKMSSAVLHALAFALYDDDEAVRVSAAEALGAAGDDRAVLPLIRAVGDESEAVSDTAVRALGSMLGPEVDAVLAEAPARERVEALKAWWRGARVRLRCGSSGSSAAELSEAAKEALRALSSLKAEPAATGAPPTNVTAPDRAARAPDAAPRAVAAQASASSAPGATATKSAAASGPAPVQREAPEEKKEPPSELAGAPVDIPPGAKPASVVKDILPAAELAAPAAKAAVQPDATADDEKPDFETMFQESGDESAEEYESILGDKES